MKTTKETSKNKQKIKSTHPPSPKITIKKPRLSTCTDINFRNLNAIFAQLKIDDQQDCPYMKNILRIETEKSFKNETGANLNLDYSVDSKNELIPISHKGTSVFKIHQWNPPVSYSATDSLSEQISTTCSLSTVCMKNKKTNNFISDSLAACNRDLEVIAYKNVLQEQNTKNKNEISFNSIADMKKSNHRVIKLYYIICKLVSDSFVNRHEENILDRKVKLIRDFIVIVLSSLAKFAH